MDLSGAWAHVVECAECGAKHWATTWVVADLDARADLADLARAGRLTFVTCPNGHEHELDEPLLIIRRQHTPALLYLRDDKGTPDAAALEGLFKTVPQEGLAELLALNNRAPSGTGRRLLLPLAAFPSAETLGVLSPLDELLYAPDTARVIIERAELSTPLALQALTTLAALQPATTAGRSRSDVMLRFAAMLQPVARESSVAWCRFELSQNPADLETAIKTVEQVYASSLPQAVQLVILRQLYNALRVRFGMTGQRADLVRAVDVCRSALTNAERGSRTYVELLADLGTLLSERHELSGEHSDLHSAIAAAREAADLTPQPGADRALILNNLSGHLSTQHLITGQLEDLDEAIKLVREAVDLASERDPQRPSYLNNLGKYWADRSAVSGERSELDAAIAAARESVRLTPEQSPALPQHVANLSSHISRLYEITGQRAALDEAIALALRAVGLTNRQDPAFWRLLNNLSNQLSTRYAVAQRRDDLDFAIETARKAAERVPENSPNRPLVLSNLANRLSALHAMTGRLADLKEAVDAALQAALLTPETSGQRAQHFSNLSAHLDKLFEATGERAHLDAAIDAAQAAVHSSPEQSTERAGYLGNLGTALLHLYDLTNARADLDAAIAMARESTKAALEHEPRRPVFLSNLGLALSKLYSRTRQQTDFNAAVAALRTALSGFQQLVLETEDAQESAKNAAAVTRQILRLLIDQGDRETIVSVLETGKAVRLRADLARSSRKPTHLNDVEANRYRSIGERLRHVAASLRRLDNMPSGRRGPSHQTDRANLSRKQELLRSERANLEAGDPSFSSAPLDQSSVVQHAVKHNEAIVYLQPMDDTAHGLTAVLVHPATPSSQVEARDVIRIPGFDRAAIRDLLVGRSEKLSKDSDLGPSDAQSMGWITAELFSKSSAHDTAAHHEVWLQVQQRVIERLGGIMTPVSARLSELGMTRVVLIPGEALGLLPLHAAPIDRDGSTFGDAFETRYAPSVTTLDQASAVDQNASGRKRLVGIANPDGTLAFSDIQMRTVAEIFAPDSDIRHGRLAVRSWLLRNSADADILSLSTHAQFAMGNPGSSTFTLAPEQARTNSSSEDQSSELNALSLDDLWRGDVKLKRGAIVVADACETGQIELGAAVEEFVGFPAAFLASGAASVVASLWSVSDFSTALLMETFYAHLKAGVRPTLALKAAVHSLRRTRASDLTQRLTRELASLTARIQEERSHRPKMTVQEEADDSMIQVQNVANRLHAQKLRLQSMAPEGLPFAHPYHWAAFAVHGAT